MTKTSFSFKLDKHQQNALIDILRHGNYRPCKVEYTIIAAETENCKINLYKSGKCLVQGQGAEEFVTFILEPMVLLEARTGYEEILSPEILEPRMGIDESGKGDFFGPMVIASVYVNKELAEKMKEMDVKDSKNITSDIKAMTLGLELRRMLGRRFSIIKIGPAAYNRLYSRMRNVNSILAWGHGKAIENLLQSVPDCPKAISDQFGKKELVERELKNKNIKIELIQRHKAESDIAVAAASIIARDAFLRTLKDMEKNFGLKFPKGASVQVKETAVKLIKQKGPTVLLETAKCHFKTTDEVLKQAGSDRSVLGAEGKAVSRPFQGRKKFSKPE